MICQRTFYLQPSRKLWTKLSLLPFRLDDGFSVADRTRAHDGMPILVFRIIDEEVGDKFSDKSNNRMFPRHQREFCAGRIVRCSCLQNIKLSPTIYRLTLC